MTNWLSNPIGQTTFITGSSIQTSVINIPSGKLIVSPETRRTKELRRDYDLLLSAIREVCGQRQLDQVLQVAADPTFRNANRPKVNRRHKI
ncbi:hypothetical protein B9J07_28105 [Sinorhizobium sp. LM21]|uniref:hypothetical protein n=1 Tax=Sinorhizobium sp. LM21 TaxID=1449788 RepID=UPI0005D810C4|nr:hypothetical protein [Sinorhizobium sp. LM21]AJW30144.1 hypothetical protein pLM21S1_p23 [Sinorhizobium sp. LM21]OWZ90451.1 hypothetical protein B9J07_28105 [Sinorhizobium sp. LM21]